MMMMEVKGALRWKLIMVRRTETAAIKNAKEIFFSRKKHL